MSGEEKDVLKAVGIDYEDGLTHFAGRAGLYEKYLKRFVSDQTFLSLEEAMGACDYETAFRSAHTLKGIVGTLGMAEFAREVASIVEMLRGQADVKGAIAAFPSLQQDRQRLAGVVAEYFGL